MQLGIGDIAPTPVRAVDPSSVIDGRPLTVSAGKVFFRSSEREMARRAEQPLPVEFEGVLAANGRWVAFNTTAQLVMSDTNPDNDVYVYDVENGTYERVSLTDGDAQGTGGPVNGFTPGGAYFPSISADGNVVAFVAEYDDLVPNDTNGMLDVFVRDRSAGTTTRVNVGPMGEESDEGTGNVASGVFPSSWQPAVSGNGRYVAFLSAGVSLTGDVVNQSRNVFLHDSVSLATTKVSVHHSDPFPDTQAIAPLGVSDDGLRVVFTTPADLEAGDGNANQDVYVWRGEQGVTARVSATVTGQDLDDISGEPSISSDGRFVAFWSRANNLPFPTAGNATYIRDLVAGGIQLAAGCEESCTDFSGPAISADGRYVVSDGSSGGLLFDRLLGSAMFFNYTTSAIAPATLGPDGMFLGGTTLFTIDPLDPVSVAANALLFPNGHLGDVVLEALDTTLPMPATTTLCPATQVTVAGGKAAYLRPEVSAMDGGTAACPDGSLNVDADVDDEVVQLWTGGSTSVNLGLAATAVAMSETRARRAGVGGTAERDDPERRRRRLRRRRARARHDGGRRLDEPRARGRRTSPSPATRVAFTVDEVAQNADLDGDGVVKASDDVLHVWSGGTRNVGDVAARARARRARPDGVRRRPAGRIPHARGRRCRAGARPRRRRRHGERGAPGLRRRRARRSSTPGRRCATASSKRATRACRSA